MRNLHPLTILPLVTLSLASCAPEAEGDEAGEEEVAEASDAFTGYLNHNVTGTNGIFFSATASVTPGTRAFLSSIGGNFATDGFQIQSATAQDLPAGQFHVGVSVNGTGFAEAWAIYPGGSEELRTCAHTGPGYSYRLLDYPSSGSFACFIRRIDTTDNFLSWQSWDDKAEITYPGGIPRITCYNNSEATAVCVPITYSYGGASGGSSVGPTSQSLGGVDWTNGKICGLTAINGAFDVNDINNGVFTKVVGSTWYLMTSQGKGASVACVR